MAEDPSSSGFGLDLSMGRKKQVTKSFVAATEKNLVFAKSSQIYLLAKVNLQQSFKNDDRTIELLHRVNR